MPVLSLIHSCITSLVNSRKFEEITNLLNLNFSAPTIEFMVSHIPLNHIIQQENKSKNCKRIDGLWKQVTDNCSAASFVYRKKIQCPIDIFELDNYYEQEASHQLNHKRQMLINMLFLGGLYEIYRSPGRSLKKAVYDDLHDCLKHNYPDIDIFDWMMVLSNQVNSMKIFKHHFSLFLDHPHLLNNALTHIKRIDFSQLPYLHMRNPAAGQTKYVLQWHKLICTLMSNKWIRRITINNCCFLWNCLKRLYLPSTVLSFCELCQHLYHLRDNDDIWDSALSTNNDASFLFEDVNDLYSDFDENLTSIKKSFSELEIIFFHNCCNLNLMKIILPQLAFLHKLAIDLALLFEHDKNEQIFDVVCKLLINPLSQLSVLTLTSVKLTSTLLIQLSQALNDYCRQRKYSFKKLALIGCTFSDDCDGKVICFEKKVFVSNIVNTLYVHSISFENESYNHIFVSFIVYLKPLNLCLNGFCVNVLKLVNIDLLYKVVFFNRVPEKNFLKKLSFLLPISLSFEDRKLLCFLFSTVKVDRLILYTDTKYSVPTEILELMQKCCSSISVIKQDIAEFHLGLTRIILSPPYV